MTLTDASPGASRLRFLSTAARSRRSLGSTLLAGVAIQGALVVSGVGAARILGVENRGHLALIVLFPFALTQLGGLGLPMATTFYIARAPAEARSIARSVLVPGVVQAALLTAVDAVILAIVLRDASHAVRVAGAISLIMVPGTLAEQYGLAMLQGMQRYTSFNVLRTLAVFLYAGGVVVVFASGSNSLVAVSAVWTLAYVLAGVATAIVVVRRLSPLQTTREHPTLGEMVRFGLKGLLGWVSPIEGLRVDQQIVGIGLSSTALGLYVVAQSLTNLPRFAAQSIGMVGYPSISGQESAHEARRSMWQFFWISVALCGALTILLELASGPLIRFFYGDEFEGAIVLTRILLISALLLGVRRCLADGARGLGWPTIGTVAEASMWVVLAPLVPVLAADYGVNGVAAALAVASGAALLVLVLPLALGWPSPPTAARTKPTRREPAGTVTAAGPTSPTSAS